MDNLKVKYWKGWITAKNMKEHTAEWFQNWYDNAVKAEEENCELVVFKVPKGKNLQSDAVPEIEAFLQERYGK